MSTTLDDEKRSRQTDLGMLLSIASSAIDKSMSELAVSDFEAKACASVATVLRGAARGEALLRRDPKTVEVGAASLSDVKTLATVESALEKWFLGDFGKPGSTLAKILEDTANSLSNLSSSRSLPKAEANCVARFLSFLDDRLYEIVSSRSYFPRTHDLAKTE